MSATEQQPAGPGVVERHGRALMPTFGVPALAFESGLGAVLRDTEGREYLDLLGGIAVNVLGHCHPAIVEAVTAQVAHLDHVSNFFATAPQVELAERILGIVTPGGAPEGSTVFLANSGTEANECAIKIVRAHATATGRSDRILALTHSFHGRSTGALALTWKEAYRSPFEPLMPGVEFIPANDVAALEAALTPDVAGVFVEPIQGEAGVLPLDDDYLRTLRTLTERTGALLVVDEVQTGMGRTGKWMGHHRSGIVPDVVTLAKGLAGGMPIGACVALGEVGHLLGPGSHGSTFGGNPVCAAAALAVIDTIEEDGLLDRAAELGHWWRRELRATRVPHVCDVRGRGLLIGVQFDEPIAAAVVATGREAGFILNAAAADVLRLAPPLVLTRDQAASFTRALPRLVTTASEA